MPTASSRQSDSGTPTEIARMISADDDDWNFRRYPNEPSDDHNGLEFDFDEGHCR